MSPNHRPASKFHATLATEAVLGNVSALASAPGALPAWLAEEGRRSQGSFFMLRAEAGGLVGVAAARALRRASDAPELMGKGLDGFFDGSIVMWCDLLILERPLRESANRVGAIQALRRALAERAQLWILAFPLTAGEALLLDVHGLGVIGGREIFAGILPYHQSQREKEAAQGL